MYRLSVLKAVGLARKDIFGASDPYVVISIGNISGDMDTGRLKCYRQKPIY